MNEWYVVTAGHCVARARASQVRVTLGEYVLKSSAEPLPGRTYGVSRIKVHPYFKFTPQADRSVVSLASRLCRRNECSCHIQVVPIPILKLHSELDAGAPVSLPFLKDNQSVCVYYVSLLVCLCVCTSVCLEACLLARHVRQSGAQSRPLDAAWLEPMERLHFLASLPLAGTAQTEGRRTTIMSYPMWL